MESNSSYISQHPLQIDLVVESILKYLNNVTELIVFRQVCCKWEEYATPKIQQDIHKINTRFQTVENIQSYLIYLDNSPGLIFTDFTLLDIPFALGEMDVQNFLSKCGQDVETLKLEWTDGYEASSEISQFKPLLKEILQNQCKNLKCLSIDNIPKLFAKKLLQDGEVFLTNIKKLEFSFTIQALENYDFIIDMFAICPALKTLSFGFKMHSSELGVLFQQYINPTVFANLRELSMHLAHAESLRALNRMEMNLEKLEIHCLLFHQENSHLKQLLEKQKDSLQTLLIRGYQLNPDVTTSLNFPDAMPNLKELGIDPLDNHRNIFIPPQNFPTVFPGLKKLNFGKLNSLELDHFLSNSEPLEKLRYINLSESVSERTREICRTVFPNAEFTIT